MNQLEKIVEYKKQELKAQMRTVPPKDVQLMAGDAEPARDFLQNFAKEDINIIAEIKKASPSAGLIRQDFNPVEIAQIYEQGGAKSLSVLTDEHFFQGHISYLKDVKAAVQLPILRKDFTLEEYHIHEARAHGADAILLIVAILDEYQMKDYHDLSLELGITPLVEVHEQKELEKALKLDLKLLGINNRNLKTFNVDTKMTEQLISENQIDAPIISESGLKDQDMLLKFKEIGVSGFLIGETFMRAKDIGEKFKEMLGN